MENSHTKFDSGLLKENVSKVRYDLIPHELLTRIAWQFTHGAEKYGVNNWRNGTVHESDIFKQSAFRHLIQWLSGQTDEDHAVAAITNIIMYEWINKNKPNEIQKTE